jgi:hypothetical protein
MIRSVYFRRIFPAAVGGMLFLIMTGLWLTGAHGPYFAFLHALGVQAFRFPFLDTHAVLAAVECHRMGIDVYTVNPCDVLGRLHVYSPLWLHLSVLPISTTWTGPVGFLLDVAFLMALAMLPAARGPMGVLVVTVAVASPAVAYALERGNNDLAMFLFALAAGRLAMRGPRLRLLGHALGVLAAALKFYPVMVLTLACRERWPRGLTILVAAGAVLAACLLADKGDLVRGLRLVPSGYYDCRVRLAGMVARPDAVGTERDHGTGGDPRVLPAAAASDVAIHSGTGFFDSGCRIDRRLFHGRDER